MTTTHHRVAILEALPNYTAVHLTLADDSGVTLTHTRTSTNASLFDGWLQLLAGIAGHIGLVSINSAGPHQTAEEHLAAILADVEAHGAVSVQLTYSAIGMWRHALPWIAPGELLSGVRRKRLAWIILHQQPAGSLRHIWS